MLSLQDKEEFVAKGANLKFISLLLIFALLLYLLPPFLSSQDNRYGNLIGFVYDKDRTTPIQGAVVKLKEISTGILYESSKSDDLGIFKCEGLKSGIYAFGVTSPQGDFNSDDLLGVLQNETAKISIGLNPYEEGVASAVQKVYQEQEQSGELMIARVVKYIPETKEAEIFIEKGLLQLGDRIHLKGATRDFYQDVKVLRVNGLPVKRAFPGQNCYLGLIKPTEIGDFVYVTYKRGLRPLFLKPLGIALVIAGTSAIVYGIVTLIEDDPPRSPFKK
jgi:hypothetical protein